MLGVAAQSDTRYRDPGHTSPSKTLLGTSIEQRERGPAILSKGVAESREEAIIGQLRMVNDIYKSFLIRHCSILPLRLMTPVGGNTLDHTSVNQMTCNLLLFFCPLADIAQHTGSRPRWRIKKRKRRDVKGQRQDARDFCYALGLDVDGYFLTVMSITSLPLLVHVPESVSTRGFLPSIRWLYLPYGLLALVPCDNL